MINVTRTCISTFLKGYFVFIQFNCQAGIRSDLLLIALEPEAASIYCKHLPVNKVEGDFKKTLDSFSPGTKYLVLDAGGNVFL